MVALFGVFGARPRTPAEVEAAAHIIERGLLGRIRDWSRCERPRLRRDRLLPRPALYQDPYPYYEYVREHGPVWREPHRGVVMITGFDEAMEVYNDPAVVLVVQHRERAVHEVPGPARGRRHRARSSSEYRDELPFSDQLPSFDPPKHTAHRGLLLRLITPKRLKENEEFMWQLADRQIDEFHARGDV